MKLFNQIISFNNLRSAYFKARRNKRYYPSILEFGYNAEVNLITLQKELTTKIYRHGGYREFIVIDAKKRIIRAAPFRDRVVHHALCNVIEPMLDKGFIYDSYACRKGKGTHAAVRRLEKFLQSLRSAIQEKNKKGNSAELNIYCLKCDISKYFESVNHEILLNILRRKIFDADTFWLIEEIVQSHPNGIPIGNLTSQLFANIYLNELDHFVKRVLRERYYIRYMDDFVILGLNKKHLQYVKETIQEYLLNTLKLELHPRKAQIFPVERGIDFLGYIIRPPYRFLRKSTMKRIMKKRKRYTKKASKGEIFEIARLNRAITSWQGYAKFAKARAFIKKLII